MSLELELKVLHSMSIELELASLRHTHLYNYVASILRGNEGPVIDNISASRIGVRQEQMRGWSVLLRGFFICQTLSAVNIIMVFTIIRCQTLSAVNIIMVFTIIRSNLISHTCTERLAITNKEMWLRHSEIRNTIHSKRLHPLICSWLVYHAIDLYINIVWMHI